MLHAKLPLGLMAAMALNLSCESKPHVATDGTGTLIICTPQYDDGYELESATVEGDTLSIGVSYSGGCANHEWELCWDGEVMESAPVQIRLSLGHNANGDSCEAIETDSIQFDISVLADVEKPSQLLLGSTSVIYGE